LPPLPPVASSLPQLTLSPLTPATKPHKVTKARALVMKISLVACRLGAALRSF
jgi:hypothetical protein